MNIPTKKLKNGFEIASLGFGTWLMWGRMEHDVNNDDQRDIDAIKYAIDKGMKFIDTAELYGDGQAERLVRQAIEWYDRDELFISTKVWWANHSYEAVKKACQGSLERLGIDCIDLYYLHYKEDDINLEETMKAMNELVDDGLVKHIAVSNFSKDSLILAQSYSKHPIVANQVHYNLIYREPESSWLLRHCQENDVMLVAWRPVQYGEFQNEDNKAILEKLGSKYNKTPFQIALNWLISQDHVTTLFKSCNPDNVQENLWALDFEMRTEDREDLRLNFPGQQSVSNTMPLK